MSSEDISGIIVSQALTETQKVQSYTEELKPQDVISFSKVSFIQISATSAVGIEINGGETSFSAKVYTVMLDQGSLDSVVITNQNEKNVAIKVVTVSEP